jgi:putative addiction module component (TIGR02574 family)
MAMNDRFADLVQKGKALPPEERERLVDILLESLEEPSLANVNAEWEAEIGRRLAEYDRGGVRAVDAAEVFAKASAIARP